MSFASWNVNSLKVRLPQLQQWLGGFPRDVSSGGGHSWLAGGGVYGVWRATAPHLERNGAGASRRHLRRLEDHPVAEVVSPEDRVVGAVVGDHAQAPVAGGEAGR